VYIDTPPAECFARLTKRGRECESGVTEDYLRRIEFQYQNFLKFTKVPVYTIDGMQEPWKIVRDIELLLVKM
jgi:thymidylate kinase